MGASYRLSILTHKGTSSFQSDLWFFTESADGTYAEALDIANHFIDDGFLDDYLACLPNDVHCDGIICRSAIALGGSATASPAAVIGSSASGGRPPDTGTGQTSNQSGPIMEWNPSVDTGERVRTGKMFFPTVNESDAEDDKIGASLLTALTDFKSLLSAGITLTAGAAQWVACIFKQLAPPPEAKTRIIRAITRSFIEGFVASQRRRRPKKGL